MIPGRQLKLPLLRQFDQMHRRLVPLRRAAPATECRLQFPDLCISRPADMGEGDADLGLAPVALHLQPAVPAVQALRDRRGGLGRTAVAFHLFRPQKTLRGVTLTYGLLSLFAGVLDTDLRAADAGSKNRAA